MRKISVVLGIIILVFIVVVAAKDQLARSAVTVGATSVVGAPVHIDAFSFGIFTQAVNIKGFKLYNPKDFPKEVLLDIPTINVAYDLGALLRKKLHLSSVRIDLKEIGIVKNKEGKLNVDSLKVVEKASETQGKKPAEQMPMQIDELILSIGRVVYSDYTVGAQPLVQVYDIDIKDKTYKNITSAQQLATLILSEPLKKTAIKGAKVYAAASVLGVGFLPAGIAITLLGKDSGQQSFDVNFDKAYAVSLALLKKSGSVSSENKSQGTIKGTVNKNDITVKIQKLTDRTTQVTVSAKRLLFPKPEIAKGILYQISEDLQ